MQTKGNKKCLKQYKDILDELLYSNNSEKTSHID